MGRVVWKGEEFIRRAIVPRVNRNMMQALMWLKRRVQLNIDLTFETHGHSHIGEMPHRVTGDLQRSIFRAGPYQIGTVIMGDVGTNLYYGVLHETTGRSFLARTLYENRAEIGRIISQGGVGGGLTTQQRHIRDF